MTPLSTLIKNKILLLRRAGKSSLFIANHLQISLPSVYRSLRQLGFISEKQILMHKQAILKKQGQRRCYSCGCVKQIDEFRTTFNNPNSFSRCCRKCESQQALARHRERMSSRDLKTSARYKLYQAKYRSKNKRVFQIDLNDIEQQWQKQNGKCFYTGVPMTVAINDARFSIDRRDSALGYTPENIVLCCHINLMKKLTRKRLY
jgi:hypothetical protein